MIAAVLTKVLFLSSISPPAGWKQVEPPPSTAVLSAYYLPTKSQFRPSINLSCEKNPLPFPQYLQSVQKLYEQNKENRWRNLGTFPTPSGDGVLTSIDSQTPLGKIRTLQLFLPEQQLVYIVTAVCLQEEFSIHHNKFFEIFRSFKSK